MSFSSDTKDEIVLTAKSMGRPDKLALLCALTHTAGALLLGRGGMGVQFVTENRGVAKLSASIASELFDVNADFVISEKEGLNSVSNVVRLSGPEIKMLLSETGCLSAEDGEFQLGRIPEKVVDSEGKVRCFLKGAFLGAGSVSDPRKGYHMEIVCRHEVFASELCGLLAGAGIAAKYSGRKNNYVTYIKDGEMISDFLTLVGAMRSRLVFEDARIMKSVSNQINRRQNFEDANMNKAAAAAAQQLLDIEVLKTDRGIESLPKRLREAAELRINNPEATLAELATLGEISKSGLNHRLSRIGELAQEIRQQKGVVFAAGNAEE